MNKAIIEQKETLVNEVSEEMKNCASTVVVEYRGLTVEKISELKRNLVELQDADYDDGDDVDGGIIYDYFEKAHFELEKLKQYLQDVLWEREKADE